MLAQNKKYCWNFKSYFPFTNHPYTYGGKRKPDGKKDIAETRTKKERYSINIKYL